MTQDSLIVEEAYNELQPTMLTEADQSWLVSFGVDPSWSENQMRVDELVEIICLGSLHIDEDGNDDQYQDIIIARERFFDFVGIGEQTLQEFRTITPALIPIDTFINTQRVMYQLGLDAPKVINTLPAAISLAPESVRAKIANLTELGLDAPKVINTLPAAIGLAPESVRAKIANLTELGLDAPKVINTLPAAISLAPESVRAKMVLLERSAKLLQWAYPIRDLVELYPAILGFSVQKLKILRRIGATELGPEVREFNPGVIRGRLIVPLEKYLISIPNTTDDEGRILLSRASRLRLPATERKTKAKELSQSGKLGRVGTMYLEYTK